MKKYKTIAFDCFGTLAFIGNPSHPYRKLLQRMAGDAAEGLNVPGATRAPTATSTVTRTATTFDPRAVMTRPLTLAAAATEFGIRLPSSAAGQLEADLEQELASIQLYPETLAVLDQLLLDGYQIAVCSNLALPYAAPVQALTGSRLKVQVWSFDVGAIKPSADIYAALLHQSESMLHETLMVGDSFKADYEGARAAGLDALHLVRAGTLREPWQIGSLTGVLDRLRSLATD